MYSDYDGTAYSSNMVGVGGQKLIVVIKNLDKKPSRI